MNAATSTVPLVGDEIKFTERQIQNFWRRVDKNGPTQPHMDTPCWVWTGSKIKHGYGRVGIGSKLFLAHRVAWFIERGPIPHDGSAHGICALHRCDNPECVRIDHLFLGTNADNVFDRVSKGRSNAGRGDQHGARLHPERLVRGDRHHARTHPEKMARGDRHGSRLHPERLARGSAHGNAKLTAEEVIKIRALYATKRFSYVMLGALFGVSNVLIGNIIRRKIWTHIHDDWI